MNYMNDKKYMAEALALRLDGLIRSLNHDEREDY